MSFKNFSNRLLNVMSGLVVSAAALVLSLPALGVGFFLGKEWGECLMPDKVWDKGWNLLSKGVLGEDSEKPLTLFGWKP